MKTMTVKILKNSKIVSSSLYVLLSIHTICIVCETDRSSYLCAHSPNLLSPCLSECLCAHSPNLLSAYLSKCLCVFAPFFFVFYEDRVYVASVCLCVFAH
jgi:hypothetical protein